MTDWKEQLKSFNALFEELRQDREQGSKLRFGLSVIVASDVAEQFYCEKKVEMEYLHGEVETEAKRVGSEAHENLAEDAMKVKREYLWQKIYGDTPVLALEMLLLARYGDVLLAGKPDQVLFRLGFPLVIFEYKFSRSAVDYLSYHVQAQTYGLLLEKMGFDTRKLLYAMVVADPKTKESKELRQNVVHTVIRNGPKEAVHSINGAKIYCNRFNRVKAEKDLAWALEFWKQSREAQATSN